MKISEKSNGRILEKWLKFPSSHSDQRNRLMNFTPAFFRRLKDLEPMLLPGLSFLLCSLVVCSPVVLSTSFCKFLY